MEKVQHRRLITTSQEVYGRLCEERAQGRHRGVTGEESGEPHDGVGTRNDVTSVTTGDKIWIKVPPPPLQEICCSLFQSGGSGDKRQHTLYLAFLLSH